MTNGKLSKEEFEKLHDELIQKSLEYTNNMADEGVKQVQWTLTNSFVVTFRDLKRKPRTTKHSNGETQA